MKYQFREIIIIEKGRIISGGNSLFTSFHLYVIHEERNYIKADKVISLYLSICKSLFTEKVNSTFSTFSFPPRPRAPRTAAH